jgi:hypothetical protein
MAVRQNGRPTDTSPTAEGGQSPGMRGTLHGHPAARGRRGMDTYLPGLQGLCGMLIGDPSGR